MTIIKCKMCGGDVTADAQNPNIGACDSCGSTMTLPNANDDRLANLFNRANNFRRQNDFDKALAAYESILNEDNNDAEAHWCAALCRFGVEYVEDPRTHERVPTIHRVQYEPFLKDADYLAAVEYAPDGYSRSLYEKEAAAIAEIQKGVLALAANEQPFDVFICYKETTDGGSRTKDSVDAQEIYHQLTNEGYKVFFARVTLEDKLGSQYEPVIFSALNSAKVMLVVGRQAEYFNAVWVKNEWSRFIALAKKDRSKLLIPCYRDMDAYDLPEELSMFQSQDMGKIGFMQDLIRGVKKVLDAELQSPSAPITSGNVQSAAEPLVKRAFIMLEDKEWDKANELLEQALNSDPENAQAYIGKLMVELKVSLESELAEQPQSIADYNNFKKAVRFADAQLKSTYNGYEQAIQQAIQDRLAREKAEREFKERIVADARAVARENAKRINYETALKNSQTAKTAAQLSAVAAAFRKLGEYQDSASQAERFAKLAEAAKKQEKKKLTIFGAAAVFVIAVVLIVTQVIIPALLTARVPGVREEIAFAQNVISAGDDHIVVLKSDGTVVAVVYSANGQCDVSDWRDIVAVSAGAYHTVGLKSDGTVIAVGTNDDGQCDVSGWRGIVAVYAGSYHTIGLKSDGTVVAVGGNKYGQCDVSDWSGIVAVYAGSYHTIGLKSDGTVVAVGYNADGQCDVSGWSGIVAVAAGHSHTVGLKVDGTVVAVGSSDDGQCDVSGWRNIVAVSAGYAHTVGLKVDGTVVAVGSSDDGQCDVSGWRNIVAVSAGFTYTIGLKADGTVVRTSNASKDESKGEVKLSDWDLW